MEVVDRMQADVAAYLAKAAVAEESAGRAAE